MYRRQFDLAEQHLDKSLALNANDADNLVQISTCKTLLGKAPEGERLFRKALRLNPYRNIRYYIYGSFAHFAQRQYEDCIAMALKGPLTDVWIDQPGIIAAAYAYTGDRQQAAHYLDIFLEIFQEKITSGRKPQPGEVITWVKKANLFKHEVDMDHLVEGYVLAGLRYIDEKKESTPNVNHLNTYPSTPNIFKKTENKLWQLAFEGSPVQISEVKGFLDLTQLLLRPGIEVHCTELMGSRVRIDGHETVMDEKARRSYEQRIRDLHEEITEAEEINDLGRAEKLKVELDQLTEHLSKALGIGNRTRTFNAPVERARAAVTWRIRSAIRKINASHPSLGKHLANSIRTGTFCCYSPEKEQDWHF